jgi:hypothetical protein
LSLSSSSQTQRRRQATIAFFVATPLEKKAMATNCRCLLRWNTFLFSPSCLPKHREEGENALAFFATTKPQKKTTTQWRHLLVFKHREKVVITFFATTTPHK